MKKILISILIILLLILGYFIIAKGLNVGFIQIAGIDGIKEQSSKLNADFEEANTLSNKTYPEEVEGLEEAIKQLKISKQEYENKKLYSDEETAITSVEIKKYKIHYLWTVLGNYKEDRGVQSLTLDLLSTETEDVYDLNFTLLGSYTSITDFIYDIENDEELNFEIKNFTLSSQIDEETTEGTDDDTGNSIADNTNNENSENTNNQDNNENQTTTKQGDGIILQAKFTVENIGITLD